MKADTVIIDHDILGWGNDHREELLKEYRHVTSVGSEPGLERRKGDDKVALHCKENNCDLLTGDRTAYEHYFDVGVKRIQISRYDWIQHPTDKAVYLIQIVE